MRPESTDLPSHRFLARVRSRWFLGGTVVLLSLGLGLSFRLYRSGREELIQEFKSRQLLLARVASHELADLLRTESHTLRQLAALEALTQPDPDYLQAELQRRLAALNEPAIAGLSLYDPSGELRCATSPTLPLLGPAKLLWSAIANPTNRWRVYVAEWAAADRRHDPTAPDRRFLLAVPVTRLSASSPLRPRAPVFAGVLVLTLDLQSALSARLASLTASGRPPDVWLMDRAGTILLQSEHPEMLQRNIYHPQARCFECHRSFDYARQMLSTPQGTASYQLNRQPRKLAAYAPVKFSNVSWVLVVNNPQEEATAQVGRDSAEVLVLVGLLALALGLGSAAFYRNYQLKARAEAEARHWRARQQLEASVLESEQRFRTLFEASPDGILILDRDTTLPVAFNDAASAQLGYAREEFARLPLAHSVASETADQVRDHLQAILRSGRECFEIQHRTKQGELRHVLVTASTMQLGGRTVVNILRRDITERKQAEEKLREQAMLLEVTQDAIFVGDLESKVQFWNAAAERLYGWKPTEVLGRAIGDFLYEATLLPGIQEACDTALAQGQWRGEFHQLAKDRRPLQVEARITLVRDRLGQPKSLLFVNTDITERKALEKQFLRAQRMESIGTLAGGIAHDLNNILAPILMAASMLRCQSKEPEFLELADTIESNAKRASDIVRQVLTFARGIEGERAPLNLHHLIHDLRKIVNETFPKAITVRVALPQELWTILGDATQLHQVFLNLCLNARDAMPEGGLLAVRAKNLRLDGAASRLGPEAKPGAYVQVQVSDTGTGITPEVLDRIFEPFFTTKAPGKGTGLGLSTVQGIVKSHGGFIKVLSVPGKGTTFRVYLPAEVRVQPEAPAPAPEAPHGQGELILVVDDEPAVRGVTSRTLQQYGYRVLPATDGRDALSLFTDHQPEVALVLTDIMMPVMDGVALVRELKQRAPGLKVIATTGLSRETTQHELAACGVSVILSKPCTSGELLARVRSTLQEA